MGEVMFGANGFLYGLGAIVFVAVVAFIKGRLTERNSQKAKELDAYEKHLEDIADAGRARPSGGVSDDPYNRDRP